MVGVKPANIIEKFEEKIGKHDTNSGEHGITEKLHTPMKIRLWEDNISRQNETHREANTKGHDIGRYRSSYFNAAMYRNVLLAQNIIIRYVV